MAPTDTVAPATDALTASALLAAAAEPAAGGDTAPRVWEILREPARAGDTGPSYGLRRDAANAAGPVYLFKRTHKRDGTHTDKNVCPALDAARASAAGLI